VFIVISELQRMAIGASEGITRTVAAPQALVGALGHVAHRSGVPPAITRTERIEPQCKFADGHQLRGRRRVATRKEGDSMALLNLLLCQIRDDTLGTTVELRRDALVKRSDLSDMKPAERKG
jgi:hypothetical protein